MKIRFELVGAALASGLRLEQPQSMDFMLYSMGGLGPSGFAVPMKGDRVRVKTHGSTADLCCVDRVFDVAAQVLTLYFDWTA